MTNAEKFQKVFGYYAAEMWAKPEKDFLEWVNSEALKAEPKTGGLYFVPARRCGLLSLLRGRYERKNGMAKDFRVLCNRNVAKTRKRFFCCGVTECDQCGWNIEEYIDDYNFCPYCGADIKGE